MRAARIHEYGPPEVLRIDEIDPPTPGPADVVIEVHASSVNPVDTKIRSGAQRGIIRYRLPHTLGLDVSGVVTAVGDRVEGFAVGDEVVSSPTHRRPGCYAEYVAIDASAVAKKAPSLSHHEAASLPLVALTAWQGLVDHGEVKAGDKVFVQAGSGGVGSIAIQIAKHFGAYVAATCSTKNIDLVRSLGADEVIDYTKASYDEVLSDYDIAVDNLGGEHKPRTLSVLKRGGRLAMNVGGIPAATKAYGPNLGAVVAVSSALAFTARARLVDGVGAKSVIRPSDGERLAEIMALAETGALKAVIDSVVPLDDIVAAHTKSETGRARGKIVVAVR